MKGKLYLIPCTLGDVSPANDVSARATEVTNSLKHFIVEDERSARRFIKALIPTYPISEATLYLLDKHDVNANLQQFVAPLLNGISMGLISEAGCPAIADPGEEVVAIAQEKGITVVPLVGPSSILLTLMASGLNGENFAFSGYLPIDKTARASKIKDLEQKVLKGNQTQLFMDTPFRNNQLLADVLTNCSGKLKLCIGTNLTLANEKISTKTVADWKKQSPDLHKQLVMFALGQ